MNLYFFGQFRVECCHELFSLTGSYDLAVACRQDIDTITNALNIRSTDKCHADGSDSLEVLFCEEAAKLSILFWRPCRR